MKGVLALLFFITACNQTEKSLEQEFQEGLKKMKAEEAHYAKVADGTRVFDGDPEPKWPGDAGDKTLEGIDADNDGVRDDVEIWINENVKDNNLGYHGNVRQAVKQYARDQIRFIMGYEKSKEAVIMLHEQRLKSRACATFYWFLIPERQQESNDYVTLVNREIVNTFERAEAHDKAADTRGSYYNDYFNTQPGEQAKFCEAKIEHLEGYVKQFKKINPQKYKNLKAEDLQ